MVRPVEFLYSLYDALVSINVPNDKVRAVVDAMERDMGTYLATKTDIDSQHLAVKADTDALNSEISAFSRDVGSGFALLRQEMKTNLAQLLDELALQRKHMDAFQSRITIRLGSLIVVMTGLILTALLLP
jgi:hypothetical protein